MDYYPWTVDDDDESLAWIVVSPDEILEQEYLLHEGVPCAEWFPEDAEFQLSSDYGTALADAVPNTLMLTIVSEKLRAILADDAASEYEFLPIRLRNPKGRPIEKPYFIANLLGSCPCLDREASDFRMDAIDKSQVDRFRHLVLDESKIDEGLRIFRLAEKKTLVIAREDLGLEILRAGCTGVFFQDMDDFGSEWR